MARMTDDTPQLRVGVRVFSAPRKHHSDELCGQCGGLRPAQEMREALPDPWTVLSRPREDDHILRSMQAQIASGNVFTYMPDPWAAANPKEGR